MFREAIIAVTKAADWYALHPLTVEELREKNIGSSVSIRYSTVGKNMTPMGNYEPSPINEGIGQRAERAVPPGNSLKKPRNTLRIIWMERENCFAPK